jgi:hypothetical protein
MNHEIISALKSRIESQQRRIITLELNGRGPNVVYSEIERLQEYFTSNIQSELQHDVAKQNDSGQRQESRIKHLEDYILVLKDELAQAHAKLGMPEKPSKHNDHHHATQHQMEQTILKPKCIVEKLQVENKYQKDSKRGPSPVPSTASYMSQPDDNKKDHPP